MRYPHYVERMVAILVASSSWIGCSDDEESRPNDSGPSADASVDGTTGDGSVTNDGSSPDSSVPKAPVCPEGSFGNGDLESDGGAGGVPSDYVSWWTFDVDGRDEAGLHDAVIEGAQIVEDPVRGQVIEFNGSDQKATTDHDTAAAGAFSVALWFNAGASQSKFATLVGEAGYSGQISGWTLRNSSSTVVGALGDGTVQQAIGAASLASLAGAWHHLALTYDGADAAIFLDGALVERKAAPFADASGTTTIGWGSLNGTESFFQGRIDDVLVYHRALGEEEVQAMVATCGNGRCENLEQGSCLEDCGTIAIQCALDDGLVFDLTTDGQWHVTDCDGSVYHQGKPVIRYLNGTGEAEAANPMPLAVTETAEGADVQFGFLGEFTTTASVVCRPEGAQVAYHVQASGANKLLYLDPYATTRVKDPVVARGWKPPTTARSYHYPRVRASAGYDVFAPAIKTDSVRGVSLTTGTDLAEADIIFGEGKVRSFSVPLAKLRTATEQYVFSCETCTDPGEVCDYSAERADYFDHGNFLPSTQVSGTYFFGASSVPTFDPYYEWFADTQFRTKNWLGGHAEPPQTALMVWNPANLAQAFNALGEFPDMLWTASSSQGQTLLDVGADPNTVFIRPPAIGWTYVSPSKVEPDGTPGSITESMIARNPDGTFFTGASKHACGGGWSAGYNEVRFYNPASHGALDVFMQSLNDNWPSAFSGKLIGSDGPEFHNDYNALLRDSDSSMRQGVLAMLERLNSEGYTPLCNIAGERDIHTWKYLEFLEYEYLFTSADRQVAYWTPQFIDGSRYGDQLLAENIPARIAKYSELSKTLAELPNAPLRLLFFAFLGFKDTDAIHAYQLAFVKQLPNAIAAMSFGSGGVGNGYGAYETAAYTLNQKYVPTIVSDDFLLTGASRTIPFGHSVQVTVESDAPVDIQSNATHYQIDSEPVSPVSGGHIQANLTAGEHLLRVWSAQDGFVIDVEKLNPNLSFVLGRPFVRRANQQLDGYSLFAIIGDFESDANPTDLRPNEDQGGTNGILHRWRDVDRTRVRYDWVTADATLTVDVMLGEGKSSETIQFLWDTQRAAPAVISGTVTGFAYDPSTGVGSFTVSGSGVVELL